MDEGFQKLANVSSFLNGHTPAFRALSSAAEDIINRLAQCLTTRASFRFSFIEQDLLARRPPCNRFDRQKQRRSSDRHNFVQERNFIEFDLEV